ncbi:MAG: PKD domain-containing protein [Taibaiella sp.]
MYTSNQFRQFFFCCLLILLGGIEVSSAQTERPPRIGITGPSPICMGNTESYVAHSLLIELNTPTIFTWTITPSTAGTILSTTNTTATIQWNTPGTIVITATANTGEVFTKTIVVGALPDPVVTSNVQLACQPLGEDPKEENRQRLKPDNCQWVCENSTVSYNAGGNAGSLYTWVVTGAASFTAFGDSCAVNWGAAGDGIVTVTETTTSGCHTTQSFCVKIISGPTAKFDAPFDPNTPITVCTGSTLVLNDHSEGTSESPIVSWHWDFGDGHISNQAPGANNDPITHQYDAAGEYEITLIVTNSCGCSASMSLRVLVKEAHPAVITCPRVACENETVDYFVDQPCDASSWSAEGGTILNATDQSVSIIWDHVDPSTGFGYVIYKACKECEMIVAEPVPVVLNAAEIQGFTNICVDEEYVYRLPKWPTTEMNWFIVSGAGYLTQTDQRNEIVLVPTGPGTITLGCHYNNTLLECGGDAQELVINVNPKTNIEGSKVVCKGQSVTYTLGGYSGTWALQDANGNAVGTTITGNTYTATFSQPGIYKLTVWGNTFCPVPDFYITVKGLPAAPVTISGPGSSCSGIPVKYTAGPLISGTTFQWSVSSGTVNAVTGIESFITFSGTPNYTVSVKRITTDVAQCASSEITKIVTDPIPAFQITGEDTSCHSTIQNYSLNYSEGDAYDWSISPANLGSVIDPSGGILGGSPGNTISVLWNVPPGQGALATLYVKVKKCNTYRTDSFKVFVRGVPAIVAKLISGLSDTTVCSGSPITLKLVSDYPVTSATSVSWEWGNGTEVFNGPAFATLYGHVYNTNGSGSQATFHPVVTIKDPNGCLGTVTATGATIYVKPAPVAYISPEGPIPQCGAFTQQLTATITNGIGGSNTYTWSPSASNSPVITTSNLGFYSVVVSNSNGCSSTSNIVEIKNGCPMEPCGPGASPAITLTGNNACGNINVHAVVAGSVISYEWIYPASTTLVSAPTATDLNASFTQAGNYQFDYLAFYRNNAGDTCIVDSAITVLVPYMADMRYEIACNQAGGNYKVTLADRSSLYPGITLTQTYYNSSWVSLGSGLNAAVNVPGGTTNTYYMVIQDAGMVHPACTTSVIITLPEFPVANFDLANDPVGCVGNAFNFWNTSTGDNLSYLWNYGTAQSQGATGGVVYATPYINSPVTLTVTDRYGCSSSKSQLITANANPYTGTVTASPNQVCQGTPVNLAYVPATGGYPSGTYIWYRENSAVHSAAAPTSSYNVTEPGGYWIKATGIYGCVAKTNTVTVEISQVPAVSISGSTRQCANVPFTLRTDSVAGATYVWGAPGALIPTTEPRLEQNLSTPGVYSYTVTVILNGCSRTSGVFPLTVNSTPAQPVTSMDIACQPYHVTLTAGGPAVGTYNWSNGGYGPSIDTYEGGYYQVVYTDTNGCKSDAGTINVPKDPASYLWIFPKGCFCKRLGETYMIGPIVAFEEWQWLQDGVVSAVGSGLMPLYYPAPGHTYSMSLYNGYCTVVSDPMYIDNEGCEKPVESALASMVKPGLQPKSLMMLLPNPARETTKLVYGFVPGGHNRSIEVYDMMGRRLKVHTVTADRGELVLPMAEYSAGVYQIVMKENGIIIQQGKLSLTR